MMISSNLMLMTAKRIPEGVRKVIIDEGFIDKATNVEVKNSPMEYLFDVYAEFLDPIETVDNWTCYKCRQQVLDDFKKLKPYLIQLVNGN